MTGNTPAPYVEATDAAHWLELAEAAGMSPVLMIQAGGTAGLHYSPPTDPGAPRPVVPGRGDPLLSDIVAELVGRTSIGLIGFDALRALLLDMLTPDRSTTLVSAVQYTLPYADRLAASLAPHLSPADKVEVSRRMAALQAMARDGNTCG